MFSNKDMLMKGKLSFVCIAKKLQSGGIHRMKQHLAGVKEDIEPCKSIPSDDRFQMENSLQKFVK